MVLPSLTYFTVGGFAGEAREVDTELLRIGGPPDERLGHSNRNSDDKARFPHPPSQENQSVESRVIKESSTYILPPKSSSITRLNLVMSVVSSHLLGRVLTLPTALESFQYEFGGAMFGLETFVASELLPGFLSQATSLKEIIIDTRHDVLDDADPLFSSLAELGVLELLVLPVSMLLRTEQQGFEGGAVQNPLDCLLPSSLVTLVLDLDHGWSGGLPRFLNVTGIPKTLPSTARHLPALQKVVIGISSSPNTLQMREQVLAEASRFCPQITLEIEVRMVYTTSTRSRRLRWQSEHVH